MKWKTLLKIGLLVLILLIIMATSGYIPYKITAPSSPDQWTWGATVGTTASEIDLANTDIIDFNLTKSITNRTGGGTMRVSNVDGKNSDIYQVGKEWKLYYPTPTTYAMGGYVNSFKMKPGFVDFELLGYTDLLKREIVENKEYTSEKPSDIVEDLLDTYYPSGGDQVYIRYDQHLEAAAGQVALDISFDGVTMFQALQQLAEKARKTAGTVPYDFWVDYDPDVSQIQIWFQVKNTTASGVTLRRGREIDFNYSVDKTEFDRIKNVVKVRGSLTGDHITTPENEDDWTEHRTVPDYWTVISEGGNLDVAVDRSGGISSEGSYSVEIECTPNIAIAVTDVFLFDVDLDLSDSDAYDALTGTISHFDTDGYLKNGDGKNQFLYMDLCNEFDQTGWKLDYVQVYFTIEDEDGNIYLNPIGINAYPNESEWNTLKINLGDIMNSNWAKIRKIGFFGWGDWDEDTTNNEELFIDHLYFDSLEELTDSDSDATSISTYGQRVGLYIDRGLADQTAVDEQAAALLARYKDPIIDANLPLKRGVVDIDIGETFTLDIPEENISNDTYRCTDLRYTSEGISVGAKNEAAFADEPFTINQVISNQSGAIGEVKTR